MYGSMCDCAYIYTAYMQPTHMCKVAKRKGSLSATIFLLGSALSSLINSFLPLHCNIVKGWVAKSVARQLATAVLWVRIQTSLKNHKWAT